MKVKEYRCPGCRSENIALISLCTVSTKIVGWSNGPVLGEIVRYGEPDYQFNDNYECLDCDKIFGYHEFPFVESFPFLEEEE